MYFRLQARVHLLTGGRTLAYCQAYTYWTTDCLITHPSQNNVTTMAAQSLQSLTVLSELPTFTGNPRPNEAPFTKSLDARTFIRSLESHFLINNITSDQKKIHILFAHIDKIRGDAVNFVTTHSGEHFSWEDIKKFFLKSYPGTAQEFRHAAQRFLETKIDDNYVFYGMTQLQTAARAVTEAYLSNNKLTKDDFDETSVISKPNRNQSTTESAPSTSGGGGETSGSQAATTTFVSSGIKVKEMLQNFLMHLVVGTQTHHRVYEKLAKMGPHDSSNCFMAEIIAADNKYKTLHLPKKTNTQPEEFIWKTAPGTQGNPSRPTRRIMAAPQWTSDSTGRPQPRGRPQAEGHQANKLKCYNCGQEGHLKRACTVCAYCRSRSHTAKNCKKRIEQARGKYCSYCRIPDSHSLSECRRRQIEQPKGGDIRMVQPGVEEPDNVSIFDPNFCEYPDSDIEQN